MDYKCPKSLSLKSLALTLTQPLIALDLETTGLNPTTARIIEIYAIKIMPDNHAELPTIYHQLLNPEIALSPQVTAIHGLRDQDLAAAPCFREIAKELFAFLKDSDLTGFNLERFDLPFLQQEFKRCALDFPAPETQIIDSWRIFTRKEPRNLAAAYQFYCGQKLPQAHRALPDTLAALEILQGELLRYPDLPRTPRDLAAYLQKP